MFVQDGDLPQRPVANADFTAADVQLCIQCGGDRAGIHKRAIFEGDEVEDQCVFSAFTKEKSVSKQAHLRRCHTFHCSVGNITQIITFFQENSLLQQRQMRGHCLDLCFRSFCWGGGGLYGHGRVGLTAGKYDHKA